MNTDASSKTNDILVIKPEREWFIVKPNNPINFPKLHYIKCSEIIIPDTLQLGGSYNYYCSLPLYFERCEIFENLRFPYKLNSPNFKVRYGLLLWPYLNLYAYTDLNEPNSVYIKKQYNQSEDSNSFIAKFKFYTSHIELYEINTGNDVDPISYDIEPMDFNIFQ